MRVDNDLQVVGQTPVDHLFDAIDPRLVDAHGCGIGDVALPAHGNSHSVEASLFDCLNHFLGDHGVAPCCLGIDAAVGIANQERLAILTWC